MSVLSTVSVASVDPTETSEGTTPAADTIADNLYPEEIRKLDKEHYDNVQKAVANDPSAPFQNDEVVDPEDLSYERGAAAAAAVDDPSALENEEACDAPVVALASICPDVKV